MGVMMLAAECGSSVFIKTDGEDAEAAMEALLALVADGFHEMHLTAELREAERAEKRSEEHTSELQSRLHLVCRLLLEKQRIVKANQTGKKFSVGITSDI